MTHSAGNFVEAFEEYAQLYNAPPRFMRWGAIWMLGTAAKRAIAMKSRGQMLCPNLYIMMVAGPSVGKSQTCKAITDIFRPATGMTFIPASVTRAGLEDFLKDTAKQRKGPDGKMLMSSECVGLADEMQGILPDQDLGHLTLYNKMFDLPNLHKAVTRTHGEIRLEAPYCSIFTGAQPAFLSQTLPEAAWGMGFMARTIMIFDVKRERRSMFETPDVDMTLQAKLIRDLKTIHTTSGWMTWTKAAQGLYDEWWVKLGGKPEPRHKRLAVGYNGRREMHMSKLAMIASLSDGLSMIVDEPHVARAIGWLMEAENVMGHIFDEMAQAGAMNAIEDILEVVRSNWQKDQPTDEATMIELLMQRFPSTQVHSIIENLMASQAIEKAAGGLEAKGFRKFKPGRQTGVI